MVDPRIRLKDPWLAALLGWLVPGAGHLYQGRTFKAAVYFFCILGTFLYGLALGDWQGVYFQTEHPGGGRHRSYGFFAQIGVGAAALPALWQYRRYYSPENTAVTSLEAPLSAPFVGETEEVAADGSVRVLALSGTIELKPTRGQFGPEIEGTFRGTADEKGKQAPQQVEYSLGRSLRLGPPVGPEKGRPLTTFLRTPEDSPNQNPMELRGEIPRSFLNRFQVPLEEEVLQHLHGRLGKRLEVALVFTWIAGLLNLLAVWDAFDGPAYGYGDEVESPADPKAEPTAAPPGTPSAPAEAAASPSPSRSS